MSPDSPNQVGAVGWEPGADHPVVRKPRERHLGPQDPAAVYQCATDADSMSRTVASGINRTLAAVRPLLVG